MLLDLDCNRLLSIDEVREVLGEPAELRESQQTETFDTLRNAGGISCTWWADGVDVLWVAALPAVGVVGVDLETVDLWRTVADCSWYCTVISESGDFVVVTSTNGIDDDHATTLATSAAVTPLVAKNLQPWMPWERDRNGWIDSNCLALAAETGAELGVELKGEDGILYIDPPLTVGLIADRASRYTGCRLVDQAGKSVEVRWTAGGGWGVDVDEMTAPGLPSPWSGNAVAVTLPDSEGTVWRLADGVNIVVVDAFAPDFVVNDETLVAAVAKVLTHSAAPPT